jgi:hypothetical protein
VAELRGFQHFRFGISIATLLVGAVLWSAAISFALGAQAQTPSPYHQTVPKAPAEASPRWQDLSAVQRSALKPLERDWPGIDGERKRKWLAIAGKLPSMSPQEQARIKDRMDEWVRLSPQERGVARQQFQAAKRVAPQDRPAQWEAYQALPAEERRRLAARAAGPAGSVASASPDRSRRTSANDRADKAVSPQAKSNIVPNPAYAPSPRPITAVAVQAQPGATTTNIGKRAAPPPHQQTGLPKIAAGQGFVDKTTLLPKRGPQGAAVRAAGASDPPPRQ